MRPAFLSIFANATVLFCIAMSVNNTNKFAIAFSLEICNQKAAFILGSQFIHVVTCIGYIMCYTISIVDAITSSLSVLRCTKIQLYIYNL